jgi:hypothetical protein
MARVRGLMAWWRPLALMSASMPDRRRVSLADQRCAVRGAVTVASVSALYQATNERSAGAARGGMLGIRKNAVVREQRREAVPPRIVAASVNSPGASISSRSAMA